MISSIPTKGIPVEPEVDGPKAPSVPAVKQPCPHPIDRLEFARREEKKNCRGETFYRSVFKCLDCGREFSL